jgi:hypothetical protein
MRPVPAGIRSPGPEWHVPADVPGPNGRGRWVRRGPARLGPAFRAAGTQSRATHVQSGGLLGCP